MRFALASVVVASSLRVCGHEPPPAAAPPAPGAAAAVNLLAQHGGVVATTDGLTTEVVAQPDGRLVAYVRDARQQPVEPASVTLRLRPPGGAAIAVPVAYDRGQHAYVGRPAGVSAGAYPIDVGVRVHPSSPAVDLETSPLSLGPTTALPAARYGGRVQIVGDHAVETVVAQNGDVAMFWMDLNGNPIPAAEIQQPNVTVTLEGRPQTLPTRVVDSHFVAHFASPVPAPEVQVALPVVSVRGVVYRAVEVPQPIVVAAMPPSIVVTGPRFGAVEPGGPAAAVGFNGPGVFAPPPPSVGVEVGVPGIAIGVPGVFVGGERGPRGHWDHGWHGGWAGRGEWHGGGGWHGGGHGRR